MFVHFQVYQYDIADSSWLEVGKMKELRGYHAMVGVDFGAICSPAGNYSSYSAMTFLSFIIWMSQIFRKHYKRHSIRVVMNNQYLLKLKMQNQYVNLKYFEHYHYNYHLSYHYQDK